MPSKSRNSARSRIRVTRETHDTPAAIARKYNLKLDALLAVNPGLNSKHLRIGQIVNLP